MTLRKNNFKINEIGSDFYALDLYDIQHREKIFKKGCRTEYLRSGREAIRYCITLLLKVNVTTALLPAYSCISMSLPFLQAGINIVYYDIDENLKPVLDNNRMNSNTVLLYVNYFGKQTISVDELVLLKKGGGYIIKDSTQDYFEENNLNFRAVDFEICSLRKWFPIPDGSVVHVFNENLLNNKVIIETDETWSNERNKAMILKAKYLMTGKLELKMEFRSIFSKSNSQLYEDYRILRMSNISLQFLETNNLLCEMNIRKKNASYLHKHLNSYFDTSLYEKDKYPLYYPILISRQNETQKFLAKKSIYCPVIWPIPEKAVGRSNKADYISNHILALPCDQRYSTEDMEFLAVTLLSYYNIEKDK